MLKALLEWQRDRKTKAHIAEFNRFRVTAINGWALMETVINQANHYAWNYSKREVSKVVPINLRWKLQLFREIHTKVLPFEPLRDQALELVTRLEANYDYRHWCAHGVVKNIIPAGPPMSWVLAKDEFHRDGSITNVERTFTIGELTAAFNELTDLANKLTVYCYALADQVEKHPLRR